MTSLGTFDVVSFKKSMENLRTIEDIDNVLHFYDEKCCFKDPFHDTQSKSAIKRLFTTMFKNLNNPRFINLKIVSDGAIINVQWTFVFKRKGKKIQNFIYGSSWLQVNERGLIAHHRDYWDSVELLQAFKILDMPLQFIKRVFSKAQIDN